MQQSNSDKVQLTTPTNQVGAARSLIEMEKKNSRSPLELGTVDLEPRPPLESLFGLGDMVTQHLNTKK